MHELTDAMRTAAAAPPPTSIDLDRLIAGEQRAGRRRRAAAMAAAALAMFAVAAVVAAGPRLGGHNPVGGPGPSATVPGDGKPVMTPPALTPDQRLRAEQLTAVLTQAVGSVLSGHSGWASSVFAFTWEPATGWTGAGVALPGYTGTGLLTGPGAHDTKLAVLVRLAPMPTDTTCVKDAEPDVECTVQTEADGSQIWRAESYGGGQHVRWAEVYRPDGVHVLVSETAVGGGPICLTLDDLVALAHTPQLSVTG